MRGVDDVAVPELDTLEAKGLIRLAAYEPELEYLFRHWLVQDAAYGSLLKQERRQLHRRVGEALEKLYPDRHEELAAVLAMHFEQAGESETAMRYYVTAGRYALERNALREAFAAFDRALKLLPPPGEAEDEGLRRRRVEIATGRLRAAYVFQPAEEVIAGLEEILPDAERLGDPELLAPIHLLMALQRLLLGERPSDPAVRRTLDRIEELADRLDDASLRATPLALIGMQQVLAGGSIREGVRALEQAVPLLEGTRDAITAAFARGALAMGYAQLGEFAKAEEASRRAYELAAEGDLVAELDAQIAEAMIRSLQGQLDEAVPLARSCIGRAEETGAAACVVPSAWLLGDAYSRQGRFAEAEETLRYGRDVAQVVDRKVWRPTLQAWLAQATAALNPSPLLDGGDDAWEEALEAARSIGNRFGEGATLWKRGEARARSGDLEAAVADFQASASILEAEGLRPTVARVLRGLGEALRALGRSEEAEAAFRRSLGIFEELGLSQEAAAVRSALGER